jgi:hypothetical protein
VDKPKRALDGIEVLDEKIVAQKGSLVRVKRWLRGSHPHLGAINPKGWAGIETVVEVDVIKPRTVFQVREAPVVVMLPPVEVELVAAACPALLPS